MVRDAELGRWLTAAYAMRRPIALPDDYSMMMMLFPFVKWE